MSKYFTLIGSRETPDEVLELLRDLAGRYMFKDWVGRSGGAQGADQCLEDAYTAVGRGMEIYLPWDGFNNKRVGGCYLGDLDNRADAYKIARDTHPAWDRLKWGGKTLHTRNVYQVLGKDLMSPSECVICYAKPKGKNGEVVGGTGTAVKLALANNIPVFNLFYRDHYEKALEFLDENVV